MPASIKVLVAVVRVTASGTVIMVSPVRSLLVGGVMVVGGVV